MPTSWRQTLKRHYFARKVRRGDFNADEPEFGRLSDFIQPGDWTIDIGANIGNYAVRLAQLVGADGRVLAFEPVPETFELLASNCALTEWKNISLFNAAASDKMEIVGIDVPVDADTGLPNLYRAALSESATLKVLCITIDSLAVAHRVRLVKIDAEGHELSVLRGMRQLLIRDHPTLIVEGAETEVEEYLATIGYAFQQLPGSWNRVYSHVESPE